MWHTGPLIKSEPDFPPISPFFFFFSFLLLVHALVGFIFFTRCSSPRGYANKEPRHLWRVGALNTQSQKNARTRGSLARKQEKQWSAAMIMHQICLHHISSLRRRKNTQLLICPSASSFSLPLPLTHSQTLAFIPAFTSLFFFSTSLSRSQKICKRNKTFFFFPLSEMDPGGKRKNINTQDQLGNYLRKNTQDAQGEGVVGMGVRGVGVDTTF